MAQRTMQLEQALDTIGRYGFLCYDARNLVDLWTPAVKGVPITLRRAVYKHRAQLADLMADGDSRCCPARSYHRQYWRWVATEKRYVCQMCLQLEKSVQGGNLAC